MKKSRVRNKKYIRTHRARIENSVFFVYTSERTISYMETRMKKQENESGSITKTMPNRKKC